MHPDHLLERATTNSIIGAFYEAYNRLGYGFLEFIYSLALERELLTRGHTVRREVMVDVFYKGELLASQRVDMIVDDKVIVEIKSTAHLPQSAQRQTLNYLKSSSLKVAILLHFGPEPAFHRLVHTRKAQ